MRVSKVIFILKHLETAELQTNPGLNMLKEAKILILKKQ